MPRASTSRRGLTRPLRVTVILPALLEANLPGIGRSSTRCFRRSDWPPGASGSTGGLAAEAPQKLQLSLEGRAEVVRSGFGKG